MFGQSEPPTLALAILARAQVAGSGAVTGMSSITRSADVIVTASLALQFHKTHHDQGEFHQVSQREAEGLSAQRGAFPTSAAGPDQGSDRQI